MKKIGITTITFTRNNNIDFNYGNVLQNYALKAFLEENGPSPAVVISENTGVPLDIINIYLRTGRLEIPEGSKYFINCERCGCSIRYGRFCPECAKILAGGIKAVFNADVGEKPKIKPKSDMAGQMHFINRKK